MKDKTFILVKKKEKISLKIYFNLSLNFKKKKVCSNFF